MPGIHAIKLVTPSNLGKKEKEPIYGFMKSKNVKMREHPLFEDLKKTQAKDKFDFARMIKQREVIRDPNGYDSLKLLGSQNESSYLDSFMSMPRRRVSMGELLPETQMSKYITKSPSAVISKETQKPSKGGTLHSASESNLSLAMLHGLRQSASEDSLYESVEMIHYRKTMAQINRQRKTRSVQKTGHPLFDHLREEQALRVDPPQKRIMRRPNIASISPNSGYRSLSNSSSQGTNSSPSSSSSGDECELYPKIQKPRIASREPPKRGSAGLLPYESIKENCPYPSQSLKRQEKQKPHNAKSSKPEFTVSNDSDEDWIIPRPRFFKMSGSPPRRRMAEAPSSTTSDESDASTKSAGLR